MAESDYERVKRAILYIAGGAPNQPSLDDVAAHVGLSPYHLQRLFRRWAGVSPKRFLQHLSATEAKRLLRDSTTVLDTAFAVGLSGSGRLHDLMVTTQAVTPGEYARHGDGLTIRYGVHDTPFGPCLIGVTDRGICALRFTDEPDAATAIAELKAEWSRATLLHDDRETAGVTQTIFGAQSPERPLPLLLRGTNFQLKVWEGLLHIPEQCVISYGDLAERIGMPSSTRAVASAVGANPVAFVIPCHRVLRSTGALGGYRWGIERKAVMLAREIAKSSDNEPDAAGRLA
jgi:AraC family transcriptional regulator of adaptative response/methylated-DNA-[protein]-cysteine methyltransferase